jgi:hypothetical protein
MKTLLFAALAAFTSVFTTLACADADGWPPFNDLEAGQRVLMEGTLYVAHNQLAGGLGLYLQVPNHYTNTIDCELEHQVPVEDSSGRTLSRTVRIPPTAIFPDRAFGRLSYPVPLELGSGQRLAGSFSEPVRVSCRGRDSIDSLPPSYCESPSRAGDHETNCQLMRRAQGVGDSTEVLYQLFANQVFIGTCRCAPR